MVRRAGLLPGGIPDGLGEDAALTSVTLDSTAVVFFPDPPENLYQIRQWYSALEALDRVMGVTILTQDSRTARTLRTETHLPVLVTALTRTVGSLLDNGAVRLVLYVGQANANGAALRSSKVIHVFLNHGESDKFVSISNQVKAFDFTFVGGPAAIDRHASGLMLFGASSRLKVIGRPQIPALVTPPDPTTIVYAPTWEGTQAINAYSTVRAFGLRLVQSILRDPSYRLVYRPHPRTGASDRTYRSADQQIRALVASHPERAEVDTTPQTASTLQRAHLLIADVSGIATDWLGQGRPLVTTTPAEPGARIAAPAMLYQCTPHIDRSSADRAAAIVASALDDPDLPARLRNMFDYYLAGMSGEESTAAFIKACIEVTDVCNAELQRMEAL